MMSATWYEEFYAGLDAMDVSTFDRFCTDDTTVTFANHPTDVGREAAKASISHFWSLIGGMRHTFTRFIEDGDAAVLEAICTYTRKDGTTVDIPVATAIDRKDGRIAAQRIYIDLQPLFAA